MRRRKKRKIKFFIAFIFIVLIFIMLSIKIRKVEVVGNKKNNEEELIHTIMDGNKNRLSIIYFIENKFMKNKNIPYVERYEIRWKNLTDIQIVIYEKPVVGYIRYVSSNFYFDKDGIVSEISNEKIENVPEFRGMLYGNLTLNKQIMIEDKNILKSMLNITNNIKRYNLPIYLVEYNTLEDIKIYLGDITVLLGNNQNMELKFSTLNDIYPSLLEKGLKGTLDLKNAKENMLNEEYIFKKSK